MVGKGVKFEHEVHDAYCAISDEVLCLWPWSLVSSANICETIINMLSGKEGKISDSPDFLIVFRF